MKAESVIVFVATEIRVVKIEVRCPNCGSWQGGWLGDPRGTSDTCDNCNKAYVVHQDADVDIFTG